MKNEVFSYNGNPVTFQIGTATMVNATEMAKPFGKRPIDWLRLPSTQEFLATLSTIRKSDSEPEVRKSHNGFVVTIKGGNDHTEQGTWMHEDVALEFIKALSSVKHIFPTQEFLSTSSDVRKLHITQN